MMVGREDEEEEEEGGWWVEVWVEVGSRAGFWREKLIGSD